jgi:nucleoside-diphosphate-sugar epimerase
MKVLITGGTGFVGSHTVAAVAAAGHRVKLFVRNPDRMGPALKPHGLSPGDCDHAIGDVNDTAAVRRALHDCEAVIHAGSAYSYALPLVQAEMIARSMQAAGAPVVITYPGGVWGPHDPYWGETAQLVEEILKGKLRFVPDGTAPFSDVREVARLHAVSPVRLPFSYAGPWYVTRRNIFGESRAQKEFGIEPRPFDESVRDTVAWMAGTRRLQASLFGRLAA